MSEDISAQLSQLEGRLFRYSDESVSCVEATKLAFIKAMLDRAKTSLAKDARAQAARLTEKAEKAVHLYELAFNAKSEHVQSKFSSREENAERDQLRVNPAKQFSLLRQDLQKGRLTVSNISDSQTKLENTGSAQQTDSELHSFGEYQVMFEKMALDRLLTKVMSQIPENAGPLNPERLVIKSFKALQDISPEYLSRLISYYESLLILQSVNSSLKS